MKLFFFYIALATLLGAGLLIWIGESAQCVTCPYETRKPTLEIVP